MTLALFLGGGAVAPPNIALDFVEKPWKAVLETIAAPLNLKVRLDFNPPGVFTYRDPQPMSPDKALELVHLELLERGVTLVRQANLIVALRLAENLHEQLAPFVHEELLGAQPGNLFVFTSLKLRSLSAADVRGQFTEVLSPRGRIIETAALHRVLVVDRVDVIRALVALLLEIDPPGKRLASPVRSFKLKHATASEVARVVSETLGIAGVEVAAPANPLAQLVDFNKMGEQLGNRQMLEAFVPGVSFKNVAREAPRDPVKTRLAIDPRLNAIFISGEYEMLGAAEKLIAALDVPAATDRDGANASETRAFTVAGGRAAEVADVLKQTFATRAGFAASGFQDKLIIRAERSFLAEVEATARRLAAPPVEFAIVPVGGSARIVAAQIAALFENLPAAERPVLVADPDDSRVAVKGSRDQVAQVRRLLANLDVAPIPRENPGIGGAAGPPAPMGAAVAGWGKRP